VALPILVVLVTLVAPVGPGGSVVAPDACAEAQSATNVALVIDFGSLAGSPGGVRRQCVVAAPGADGIAVLQGGGHSMRFNSAGLLCAIDGYPGGTDCGVRTASGYRYWAYFTGTATGWQYMSVGPGFRKADPGRVEGWHFVEGTGKPGDPPPAAPSDPSATCRPAPTTTAPPPTRPRQPALPALTVPSVTLPPPGAAGPTGPGTAGPSGPDAASGPAPSGDPAASIPVAGGDPVAGADAAAVTEAARGTAEAGTDALGGDGSSTGDGEVDPVTGAVGGAPDGMTAPDAAAAGEDLAAVPAGGSPSGSAQPVVLVAALIAGLGGAAAWRFRRRPDG
jgi:hypothetical protein